MKSRLIVFLLLLTTFVCAQTMWEDALPIRQGVNIEWYRTSATTDDGGIIYVWSDTKNGDRDLFAMKFDALGVSQWGQEPTTIDNKSDRQEAPVIVKTSDGNFVIAWIDYSLDQDGDVFAQKINNAGELLWQEGGVPVCTNQDDQISLNIVKNNVGGAYLLWNDKRDYYRDLYGANLDGNGNNLWNTDGIYIASTNNSLTEDGDGGFVIAYDSLSDNISNVFANRFNSNGQSVWGQAIPLTVDDGYQGNVKVASDGLGAFVFVWEDRREDTTNIFAQRLLSDGSADWGQYIEVYSDEDDAQSFNQSYPQIQADGLGNTIIAWEDSRNSFISVGLLAQKISSTGAKLWAEDGVEIRTNEVRELTFRIDSDTNGGAFLVWTDMRNGDFPQVDIFAQHLNSEGIFQWGEAGLAICTATNEQNFPLIKKSGDNIFAVWLDGRTGSKGINQQIINASNNTVLAENGQTVFYGLSGDAGKNDLIEVHPRPVQNDLVVVWWDSRYAINGYQIFFQFINPDGSVDLEENGRPLTIPTGHERSDFNSVTNPEGQTMVLWQEQSGYYPKIYAQLIDVDGSLLWGDEGMEMTTGFTAGQENPRVSYYNGDFYLGWSDNILTDQSLFIKQVFGQRISNGAKQWGESGIQLSGSINFEYDSDIQLYDLIGNYYVWNVNVTDRRVAKVNEAGQVMEGYSIEGNSLVPEEVFVDGGGKGAIYNNTLYYSWADDREDQLYTIYTQGLTDDGSFTWQEEFPTSLHNYDGILSESRNPDLAIGDAIYVTWEESTIGYNENIKAQKISFSGEKQFAEEGLIIAEGDFNQRRPVIEKINDDYHVIAWEQEESYWNKDIYMNLLKSNGETLNGSVGIPLTTELKDQNSVRIAPMGDNKAFFVWADGRSSGKTSIFGIYAQYVDFSAVSNDDSNDAQIANSSLAQNYPNPFNPTTRISFNLAKDTKDVELTIYNVKGQKVKTLAKDSFSKGSYSFVWNGLNEQDKAVASGLYFYNLKAGNQTETRKMVLMK